MIYLTGFEVRDYLIFVSPTTSLCTLLNVLLKIFLISNPSFKVPRDTKRKTITYKVNKLEYRTIYWLILVVFFTETFKVYNKIIKKIYLNIYTVKR